MITLAVDGGSQLPNGPFTDVAERFPLGARGGVVTPTAEPVSDSAVTPFGLTLRMTPSPCNVVQVRTPGGLTMATDKVTTHETDGRDDGSDTQTDYISD